MKGIDIKWKKKNNVVMTIMFEVLHVVIFLDDNCKYMEGLCEMPVALWYDRLVMTQIWGIDRSCIERT